MNVERIIHKFNVRNYVSKLESPCESMSDHSSRNCFNLSHLMKIVIESPQTLSEEELKEIVDVWNGKPRRRRTVV